MDYQHILEIAEKKLQDNFVYIINDIKDCISQGSTGSEISSIVGKFLKDLKIKNSDAYLILEKDIEEYLNYCEKIGLKIK